MDTHPIKASVSQRVLIADDHTILRQGLRALLTLEPNLEVVGEAENGQRAIQEISRFLPNLVLMDLSMPKFNGTESIHHIKKRYPNIKIIVLTVHKTEEHVRAALRAGADGYILKDDSHDELIAAINHVSSGKKYLSPGICGNIVDRYLDSSNNAKNSTSWDTLTNRERQVLKLVAEGIKNREIAEYLTVSLKTVEKHRANFMKKLDLHSSSEITAYAIENGLANCGEV